MLTSCFLLFSSCTNLSFSLSLSTYSISSLPRARHRRLLCNWKIAEHFRSKSRSTLKCKNISGIYLSRLQKDDKTGKKSRGSTGERKREIDNPFNNDIFLFHHTEHIRQETYALDRNLAMSDIRAISWWSFARKHYWNLVISIPRKFIGDSYLSSSNVSEE